MYTNELIAKRKRIWNKHKCIDTDIEYLSYVWKLMINEGEYKGQKIGKQIYIELKDRPWLLIELCFRLRDKELNLVPFFLNRCQRDFLENKLVPVIMEQREGIKDQIKFVILKSRQLGMTTLITAFLECMMMMVEAYRGFTMAHDAESTNSIFDDKAKGMYEDLNAEYKKELKRSNAKEMVFNENKSAWRIATAGSKGAGRGKTINFLHSSEVAFWDKMEENVKSISQALTNNSIEVIESTANGYNSFKDLWDKAIKGHNSFIPVFYVWWDDEGYVKRFKGVEYTEEDFDEAIHSDARFMGVDSKFMRFLGELKDSEKLSLEQLHWYFYKRLELKEDIFQEYPCYPEQAFLHSGRPYFDIELLDMQITKNEYEPVEVLRGGEIEIYSKPIMGRKYVIGADVAEGLDTGDSSAFVILDLTTGEEVANGEFKMKPDDFGDELFKWMKEYNGALTAVERNNHGHATLAQLRKLTAKRAMYASKVYMEVTQDKKNNKTIDKPGWLTNAKSKPKAMDKLDSDHRYNRIIIKSLRILKQMRMCQNENGKVDTNGKDLVAAIFIANAVRGEGLKLSGDGKARNLRGINAKF